MDLTKILSVLIACLTRWPLGDVEVILQEYFLNHFIN